MTKRILLKLLIIYKKRIRRIKTMKHSWKKATAAVLAATCLIGGASVPTLAYDTQSVGTGTIEPMYVGITSASCRLSISSGTATSTGSVSLKSGYSAKLTLSLQRRKDSNSSWTSVNTWTGSGSRISKSASVSSGYQYRAKLTAKIYKSNGTLAETVTATSATKSY